MALRVIIAGRVQGVGYRDWMAHRARKLGLAGWVRNRADGTVEALIEGDPAATADLLRSCRRGPPLAAVTSIVEYEAEPPEEPGFLRRPTV
jgi:acylphosphatase